MTLTLGIFYPDRGSLQTSYNGNKRDRYAGVGMRYNPEKDRFEPTSCPLGNKSHVYDEELNWFVPPKPQPDVSLLEMKKY